MQQQTWRDLRDLIYGDIKKLFKVVGQLFKPTNFDELLEPKPGTPQQQQGGARSKPPAKEQDSWEKQYLHAGIPLSQQQYTALQQGNAVLAFSKMNDRNVWLTQPNTKSEDHATKLGVLGPQYNYNITRVLRKLPLAEKNISELRKLKDQLYAGQSVPTLLLSNGRYIPVRIAADPLNRSVQIVDQDKNKIPLDNLGVKLTPPRDVDHYAIYLEGKKVGASPHYISTCEFVNKQMDWHALQNIETRMSVHAMFEPPNAKHDREVLLTSKNSLQALSAQVTTGTTGDTTLTIKEHTKAADMHTAPEKALREKMAAKPHMYVKDYIAMERNQRHLLKDAVKTLQPDQPTKHQKPHL